MASLNKKAQNKRRTHEGAVAHPINAEQELRRSVMASLLWESNFYENGKDHGLRIKELVAVNNPAVVANMAIEARQQHHLRHVPLLLTRELLRHPRKNEIPNMANVIDQVVQRPDELSELLSMYWADGKRPLPGQLKKGLAKAFTKFSGYQLAKWNRDREVKLRDVLFMCHAKPKDAVQEAEWKKLVDGTLPAPDTWEVALSGGADKASTFTRLIEEKKLGHMALMRNLRNMEQAGVNRKLATDALIAGAKHSKALPFRYLSAARACPRWEREIDRAMQASMKNQMTLPGKTILLVDHSGSMNWHNSNKSDLTRFDSACALAILLSGICEDLEVYAFSSSVVEVPPRQGMALADALRGCMHFGGTRLGNAVGHVNQRPHDRLIVITDEQSHDRVAAPRQKGYMINVATYNNGVGYGAWTHIDGFSEAVVNWMQEYESLNL